MAKKNRNFFPDGRDRDKRKLGTYGKNLLGREGHSTSLRGKKYRLAERVGRLSKLGRVKLVFSRRAHERSWIAMATNATRWGALRVLNHYLDRWPIEVFFKESKQSWAPPPKVHKPNQRKRNRSTSQACRNCKPCSAASCGTTTSTAWEKVHATAE